MSIDTTPPNESPKPAPAPASITINNGGSAWKTAAFGMVNGLVASIAAVGMLLGYQWLTVPAPGPAPGPEPKKIVLRAEDSKATQNNRTCDAEVIGILVNLANRGNGVFVLESFPPGEAKEIRTITVVGGPEPDPPNPPGPGPKPPNPPDPPTPPKPLPTGFAGDVATKAKGLPAADCKALASNYQVVSSMIAAGGITKIEEAVVEITKLNKTLNLDKPTWTPFASWLEVQFNLKGKTLAEAKTLMDDVVVGLEYVGGQ